MPFKRTAMKVLAFGEVLWDIIEGQKYLGGAPFNFAAHVVKCGGTACVLSAVGDDELGWAAIDSAKDLRVDTGSMLLLNDYPTGTVDVFLHNGQPDYTIHEPVAFDFIPEVHSHGITPDQFDVFYFGTLAQRNVVSRTSLRAILQRARFRHIFFDINLRKQYYSKEIIKESLEHCTILKINDAEVAIVSNLLYEHLLIPEVFARKVALDYNLDLVIITAAEKGCSILKGDRYSTLPGEVVEVADAVGAGDSFSAAFMCSYLQQNDELTAGRIANKVGAFVASKRGAIPMYSEAIRELFF